MTETQTAVPVQDEAKISADMRMPTVDGFDNFVSRIGLNNDNTLSSSYYTFNLLTRNRVQLEAAYRGSWIAGMMVDAFADDMTRAGVDITSNEQNVDLKDLYSKINELAVWDSINNTMKWARLYGGAIGVLQVEGQDPSTPLNVDSIAKDQFKGIVAYDRWQLQPSLGRLIKSGPEMGLPEYYDIVTSVTAPQGVGTQYGSGYLKVHHTRCLRMIGIQLPYFQAITEMLWGESILERLWDRMIAFDNATMSSASLIDRANLRTVKVEGLRQIIAAGGKAQQALERMFDMMRLLQVNEGLTLLDKNDDFATTAYSFAGLSDMMLQFGQQLAGAGGIPLVRLFGQSPAGLSSTGESDLRMYYDNINAQQNAKLRLPLDKVLRVMWRSVYGRNAPKDLEFQFNPLWQTSDMDKATISKTNTESIIGAHSDGLISTGTAMKELREMSGVTGLFSNISDEEIAEAEEEPPLPLPKEGQSLDDQKEVVPQLDAQPSALQRIKRWLGRK
jgi:phage-related protein, HI1409 family